MTRSSSVYLFLLSVSLHLAAMQAEYLPPDYGSHFLYTEKSVIEAVPVDQLGFGPAGATYYLTLGPDTIALTGWLEKEGGTGLVLMNRKTGRREVLGTYPTPSRWPLTAAFEIRDDPPMWCVIFQYKKSLGHGDDFEHFKFYLQAFVVREGKAIHKTPVLQVGETDVDEFQSPERIYTVPAMRGRVAGKKRNSRVLIRDVNQDGYNDLVLWQKYLAGRQLQPGELDPEKKDTSKKYPPWMTLVEETMRVMLFDPEKMVFTEPAEWENLPKPNEGLWNSQPQHYERR